MASIEKSGSIKKEDLSGEHYLESILARASALGMLCDNELERIQLQCLALLAKRTERYNGGESSSIPIEKAQDILASILYTIGVQLKAYPCPEDAAAALQGERVEELYEKGRSRIDGLVKRAKMLHATLIPRLIETENEFYHSTAVDGIKGFFKLYDPDFAAQEIHITADYPVYNRAEKLAGIEFIRNYIEQIYHENQFCKSFNKEDIHHLLRGYHERYKGLLFNLYEPILAAALGCVLAGADAQRLVITPAALEYLYRCFTGKGRLEVEQLLRTALAELSQRLALSGSLQKYVEQSLPQLATTIEHAAAMGELNRVFLLQGKPENHPRLVISYGEKMDNERYRRVLEEFIGCEAVAERMDIIKEKIHSLADLNDLLLDASLSAETIAELLKHLGLPEIAALLKRYTPEPGFGFLELRDAERVLCAGLHGLLESLPPEQRLLLQRAAAALEVE